MRCQPANAGPRKTPRSISLSLSLFLSLSPFSPSFASHSVFVLLTDIFSVFLSFVKRARACTHSLLPRPTRCRRLGSSKPPKYSYRQSWTFREFFRPRARAMRSVFSSREREKSEKEKQRERERMQSRRVYARSLLAIIYAPDVHRNSRSTKEI